MTGNWRVVARLDGAEIFSETVSGEMAGRELAHIEATKQFAVSSGEVDAVRAATAVWTLESA